MERIQIDFRQNRNLYLMNKRLLYFFHSPKVQYTCSLKNGTQRRSTLFSLCSSMIFALNLFFSPAYADLAPEPAQESTDTSTEENTEDTAEGADDEKSGCSSAGMNVGISMLPIVFIGLVTLARSREEE